MKLTFPRVLIAGALVILLAVGVYFIPPVHDRLAWRLEELRNKVYYFFNPPEDAAFQPSQQEQVQLATIVAATMKAYETPLAPTATDTPLPAGAPTFPPTVTPTPLPGLVQLEGIRYEHQHGRINYCGPANFSMALNYWGWFGDRDTIGKALKPSNKDKNIMPYEFQDYIRENIPDLTSIIRYGGDIELLKRMVAGGFPVVIEKGIYDDDLNGNYSWMGHYAFVTGYDETKKELIYQDSLQPEGGSPGRDRHISYDEVNRGWRAFNYVFIVVYPYAREAEVINLLGNYVDDSWASRHALEAAQTDIQSLKAVEEYFAWFNAGTSHVALQEYADAATAYDYAFQLYADLPKDDSIRPYRMMWYQTGPYKAYFYSGRYADVLNLANLTLKAMPEPILEESLYWRGQAEYMLGDTAAAIRDYRAALAIHPGWGPAVVALQDLGVAP
jgi:hypothetical protein